MEGNKKTRVIAIIALIVAIVCVSIGFAAMSTTLNSRKCINYNRTNFN